MRTQKSDLRRHVLARRDLVSPAEAQDAARTVAAAGLALVTDNASPGATVAAYWAMRRELSARLLMEALARAAYPTALPVTHEAGQPLSFRMWTVGDDLSRGALGNAEPLSAAPVATPDVLFVPLAAFDVRGGRIGYGAGHYDATLAALRAQRPVLAIGLAYDIQEIDAVPLEPHDQRLDYVVTETRVLATGKS